MKLRYIFTMLASLLMLAFTGCQQEEGRFLGEVKVSQSYIAIPAEGGSVEITVDAIDSWSIAGVPEWLTVSPASGSAGTTKVTFTAGAATSTNEAVLSLDCAGASQTLNVLQMTEKLEVPISTCDFVNNQGEDGVIYRVKGTVTSIANTVYGNWYLNDGTGEVYVYGTLYEGATQQFTKHGLEVGDIVTVEGPRKNYNGTIELVDVTVIEIEKSLIKVDAIEPETGILPLEGGEFNVTLTAKGDGVSVVVPEAAKSWLYVTGIATSGSTAVVTFNATANEGGKRNADLEFVTTSGGVEYKAMTSVTQEGSIVEVSVADFLAQPDGTALFKLTGKVKNLQAGDYGNFDLVDATGSVYVYGLTATPVEKNDKSFPTLGIKEGDVVTLIGTRASYKGTDQVGGPAYYVSHVGHVESTVADFLAQPVAADKWYQLTGTIANLVNETYGNFDLVGEDGSSVYVYGLTVAPVAKNDKSFAQLGLKEGDVVTLIGTRAEYNGAAQVGGPAYYISHVAGGATEPETPVEPETPATATVTLTNAEICAVMTSSETAYSEYTIESASGVWTVNASKNKDNTFLQCRGKKGGFIKTPAFDKDIKSVTLHFTDKKSVYPDNVYCAFPSTWTAPTEDAAYPEDGNVGKAVTDGSYSVTIPVAEGNKQVYVSIIGTYSYYLDHIDVAF